MTRQAHARPAAQADTSLPDAKLRVGVMAGDPLRLLGFQSVFDGHHVVRIVPVAAHEPLQQYSVDVLLIAAQSTEQMFGQVRGIRAAGSSIPVIVMASPLEPEFAERVLRVGAHGYLNTTATQRELEDAIAFVYEGEIWTPARASRSASAHAANAEADYIVRPEAFTVRERQVMTLLTGGQSNREIALGLRIEERTVKSHVARLLKKMGVRNRTALTMQAIARGLVGNDLDS
ncbi:MAG: response regulator transcription factor [Acidobacteriaceae bacterium]|jgi:DNA-binding NarL/FixJ family response regulator|nr:response regulator transcription factor [Acidobacteriaceae bacterium]